MITKDDAKKLGVAVVDGGMVMADAQHSLIEQVKALLPHVVNSDNQLNTQALAELMDIANTTSNNQGYELTFAGKGLARAKADQDTTKELAYIAQQSKATGAHEGTENVIIRGDNIDALKILYKNYHNSIKMIYIDPPYNTRSENFIYNDNFKASEAKLIEEFGLQEDTTNFLENVYGTRSHSGWLAFMYPRLKLARELLADDGVIFISIDDNEQANLKVMCDEIFGEDNVIMTCPAITNLKGNQDSYGFAETHEYVLVCTKARQPNSIGKYTIDEETLLKEWEEDEYGLYKEADNLRATGVNAPRSKRPNLFYPIFLDEKTNTFYVTSDDLPKNQGHVSIFPINPNSEELSWYWKKDTFNENKHNLILKKTDNGYQFYRKQRPDLEDLPTKKPKSFFYKASYSSSTATTKLKELLGCKAFNNPKPVPLIKDLVYLGSESQSHILDFFAGSGTTAHAVMQQNAEDGGNRKYILVQWDETINPEKSKTAHDFCVENKLEPVISSIAIERVNRAGEKIKAENPDAKVDIGYKVYGLTDKPAIYTNPTTHQLELSNGRKTSADTLVNMLVATCKPLHTPIKEIAKDKLYEAGGEVYVIGAVKPEDLAGYADKKINIDPFANFNLEDYLNLDMANRENVTIVY